MKKLHILFALIILFILNGCRGREMPMKIERHATDKQVEIKKKRKPYLHIVVKDKPVVQKKKKNHKVKQHQPKRVANNVQTEQTKVTQTKKSVVKKDLSPPVVLQPSVAPSIREDSPKKIQNTALKKSDEIINSIPLPSKSFSGGGLVDHLDMGEIRIGKSTDYTSIIFDSYIYVGKHKISTKKAKSSGTYLFTYEPSKNRIVAFIDGYNDFSALKENQEELFKESKIVKNIYVSKYIGNDGVKFIIQLRKKVRVNIFDVKNPGRIIVNLFPQ